MRILFCVVFCVSAFQSFAQDISWGELNRQSGNIFKTIPIDSNQFLVIRYYSRSFVSSYSVEKFQGFEKIRTQKLRTTAQKHIATFRGIEWINNQLVMFVSNRSEGKEKFYAKIYDEEFNLIEDKLIGFFDLDKKRKEGVFHYQISENKKYIGVYWNLNGKRDLNHIYGFKIFDFDWQVLHEGEYEVPLPPDLSTIHNSHVSNRGDFFLCVSEFTERKASLGVFKKRYFKQLHIYHIAQGDGLYDYEIELENKEINAVGLSSADTNLFTVTGVYRDSLSKGISGIFLVKIDLENQQKMVESIDAFDSSFVNATWNEKQLDLLEKRFRRNKIKPGLLNYEMREIVFMKDGSIFCSLEQFYIDKRHEIVGPTGGGDYPVNYFNYNDVVGYKIGLDNKIQWIKKIDKRQTSIDDNGFFSGFFSVVEDTNYSIYFNDNVLNYSENGIWDDKKNIAQYSTSKNTNAFAEVTINMKTGEIQRKAISSRFKSSVVLIPQYFARFKGQILMAGVVRGKERFARLKID